MALFDKIRALCDMIINLYQDKSTCDALYEAPTLGPPALPYSSTGDLKEVKWFDKIKILTSETKTWR
jgi:hypothetical protein